MNDVGVRWYDCATQEECKMTSRVVGKRLFSISIATSRKDITIHLSGEEVLRLANHLVQAIDETACIAKVMK